MISGEMDPRSPAWLSKGYETLKRLGYTPITDSDDPGKRFAQQTEAIGLDYLRLYLTEPDQAVEGFGDYLERFEDINRSVGILSRVTSSQFGMLANIASLHYTTDGRDRQVALHRQLDKYLSGRNSASISGFTAHIHKPELLRDLVAHWAVLTWPSTGSYARFLKDNIDWEDIQRNIEDSENNPVLFALAIPLGLIDPGIRQKFRTAYPELAQQGVDIIAAGIFNRGAHNEILRDKGTPDSPQWYKDTYKGWEDSIYEALEKYGIEVRPEILRAITEARWNIFPEGSFSFKELIGKITSTFFSLNEEGKLVRNTHQPAETLDSDHLS